MFGTKVRIDPELYEKVKQHAKTAGYATVEECVHHILEKAVHLHEEHEQENVVEQQLKGLGYLD